MNQTTIEFSIPDEIYEQAKEICESNGLTLEEAYVRFLEATVACGGFPTHSKILRKPRSSE